MASAIHSSIDCCSGGSTSGARSTRSWRSDSIAHWSCGSTGWWPGPSSSGRSRRSPSSGRGPRASTTCTRVDGRARRGSEPERRGRRRRVGRRCVGRRRVGRGSGAARRPRVGWRHAVRRGDADREPVRRDAAGSRGARGRPLDRGRGHATEQAAPGPPRDRRADDQLPRPERAGPARLAAGPPAWWCGPRARDRCRDAGRQRPGRGPRGGVGGGGRPGRADSRRLGRARRRGRDGRDGAALVVRGVPATVRARPEGPARGHRRRRPRDPSCSRRPGGSRPRSGILPRPAAWAGPVRCAAN